MSKGVGASLFASYCVTPSLCHCVTVAGEMLHEIILSLLGFTGNIIVRNRDDSSFEVNNSYSHTHTHTHSHTHTHTEIQEGRQDSYGDVFDLLTEAEQVSGTGME